MNERKPVETYKELANDYRESNWLKYPHFDYDDLLKIEAYIDIKNIYFDIDEHVANLAGISLETFQNLNPDALNITIREILPQLVKEEHGPDGTKVLERMAKFSEQVREKGAQYYLFGEDDLRAGDTEVEWMNDTKTQVKVNSHLLGINDTAWVDLPLTDDSESVPLCEALKPSPSSFEGDFDIEEVFF